MEFAFVALSHIPDEESISLFRSYLDPEQPIYRNLMKPEYARSAHSEVLKVLELRLSWSETPSDELLLEYFRRHYISSGIELPIVPAGLLMRNRSDGAPSTATLIAELASPAVRQKLIKWQRDAIDKHLQTDPTGKILKPVCRFSGCSLLELDSLKNLGLNIIARPEDYIQAATDWILDAEKYQMEKVSRSIALYCGETMY
jgi:hypothetical protein